MMKFRGLIIFLAMLFLLPSSLSAHGVRGETGNGGVVVSTEYDNGEPMSYAKVKILAPDTELTFQSGRTDRNGRFCIFPDIQGDWKVVVDDGMGHFLEVKVPIDETLALQINQQGQSDKSSLSKKQKALMGISIIFGISGIFFWWKGRKIVGKG